jgi:hypothetical protein
MTEWTMGGTDPKTGRKTYAENMLKKKLQNDFLRLKRGLPSEKLLADGLKNGTALL